MGVFMMSRNARVFIDGERHRLLKQVEKGIWQIELERTGRLIEKSTDELLEMLRVASLSFVDADGHPSNSLPEPIELDRERKARYRCVWETASILEQEAARAKLRYVRAVLVLPKSKNRREVAIQETAVAARNEAAERNEPAHCHFLQLPSFSTVSRWEAAFIKGGRDVTALLDRLKARGNRTSRIPWELRELIEQAIDEEYLQETRPTIQDTLDVAITAVATANTTRAKDQKLSLPTFQMVRSLIRRRDPYEVCVARYGQAYARHKYRLVLKGNEITEGLVRAEIDHTPINCLVIDERTFLPLGRPYLTLCIDVAHRVVLGYALSFEPPSYLSVMRCLRHAILPKTYLRSRYPDVKGEWPVHGVFDSVGMDNGPEFHADALRDFGARFFIDLDYCEVRCPWLKGIIERAQGTLNRGVAHGKPGTTFENEIERGDYDSASEACITLEALHRAIHIWIVDHYHQKTHRGLGVSPLASWTREMQHREIPLPHSAVELDQALAVRFQRTLTHKGIELDHLFYNSPDVLRLLTASNGRLEVDVGRPADDVGYIYLNDPLDKRVLRVPVLERFSEYATGLTPWQHAQCVRYAQRHYGGRNDVVALASAKHRIRDCFMQALAKLRSGAKRSAARFLASSVEARNAFMPEQPAPTNLSPAAAKPSRTAAESASVPATPAASLPIKPRKLTVAKSARNAA